MKKPSKKSKEKKPKVNKAKQEEFDSFVGPTPWVKLGEDEKVERLRTVIKEQAAHISRLHERLVLLESQFLSHEHGNGGKVLLPPNNCNTQRQSMLGNVATPDPKQAYI